MIPLLDLTKIIQRASEVGVAQYIKKTQPAFDLLTKRECYKWIATLGVPCAKLDYLLRTGVIEAQKAGDGKNSPLLISKSDIITYLLTKEIGQIYEGD